MWTYISNDYIKLIPIDGEIGSSTMPQKVNPINFELAEGNLGMSNAIASFMIDTLSKSRLQRHLSDSTIIRNIGVVFAHHHLALKSLITCMGKISPNNTKMKEDLESHPEVHLEMIQIILKISGQADGYEKVKDFSRGKERSAYEIRNFINSLPIPQETRQIILNNIDTNYCGSAEQLTDIVLIEADRVIQVL
jgi:adenylosuccinate lyase